GHVLELPRVGLQSVKLLRARSVRHEQEAPRANGAVRGRTAPEMFDEEVVTPQWRRTAEERKQALAVHRRRGGDAGRGSDRGSEVDVEGEVLLRDRLPGSFVPTHQQGDADAFLVRHDLAR